MQVRESGASSFSTGCGEDLVQRVVGLACGGEKTLGGVLPGLGRLVRRGRGCNSQFRAQAPDVIAYSLEMIRPQRAQKRKVTLAELRFACHGEALSEAVQSMSAGEQPVAEVEQAIDMLVRRRAIHLDIDSVSARREMHTIHRIELHADAGQTGDCVPDLLLTL